MEHSHKLAEVMNANQLHGSFSLILLLLTIWSLHQVFQRPTPPAPMDRRFGGGGERKWIPIGIMIVFSLVRLIAMAIFVVEALVAFAAAFPSQPFATSWIENLCTAAPSRPETYGPSISILELLAVVFIIFGAQLRLYSQRVLGRHFTFELSVLDKHELVTSGPYRYVRHPGYTGFFFFILGLTVYPLARGTLLRECIWHSWNITSTTLYAVQVGLLVSIWYLITTRASIEDAMLQETFGGEWERWAKTTRYKLFPGVL